MNTDELKQIALAAAKNIKTQQDLTEFQRMLTKVTVEAALNAELDDHLGYERHETSDGSNYRNGYSSKTVQTDVGQFELDTPRDRNGDFDPQLVKKNQRRFTAMDDKILFLYAQGMTMGILVILIIDSGFIRSSILVLSDHLAILTRRTSYYHSG